MVYVLSDIHGNKENFDRMLKIINLQPDDSLYILGDVIDRHPHGIQLLQQIMRMPNTHMLLGNHEWMMMKALGIKYKGWQHDGSMDKVSQSNATEKELLVWYMNNGKVTHDAWEKLTKKQQKQLTNFLSELPLEYAVNVNGQNYRLVHAAPVELYQRFYISHDSAIEFALWDREMFHYKFDIGATIVFGHTATCDMQDNIPLEIWNGGNMIGIDCGSGFMRPWRQGRLACLRLEDMQVFYSK